MSKVTILDLDAVIPEREVVVKLDGKDHKLVPVTLEDYLKNTKLIRDLATGGEDVDFQKEFDIAIDMVDRAFPSITKDRLQKLTLIQLNKLAEFARGADGTEVAKDAEVQAAEANPPTAG